MNCQLCLFFLISIKYAMFFNLWEHIVKTIKKVFSFSISNLLFQSTKGKVLDASVEAVSGFRTATNIYKITFRYEFFFTTTTTTTLVEFDEKLSEEKFFSSLYPFEIQWCFRFSLIFYSRINFFRLVSKFFLI